MKRLREKAVQFDRQDRATYIIELNGEPLAKIKMHRKNTSEYVALMCSAPELLEALEELVKSTETALEGDDVAMMNHMLDAHDTDQCTLCAARVAISKAKGETS